jgi:hypothetical protein
MTYEIGILCVALCVHVSWFFILREEHRLRVHENRVRRRIFGDNREKLTGGLRKLHKEKCHVKEAKNTVVEKQEVSMQCEQQTDITFLLNQLIYLGRIIGTLV